MREALTRHGGGRGGGGGGGGLFAEKAIDEAAGIGPDEGQRRGVEASRWRQRWRRQRWRRRAFAEEAVDEAAGLGPAADARRLQSDGRCGTGKGEGGRGHLRATAPR